MLIHKIKLNNILSFGPSTDWLDMQPLNVLIGPNGSGKSNLIEALGLLHAAPRDIASPIREGGGVQDWIWKGEPKAKYASIDVMLSNPDHQVPLRYLLAFAERGQRFELTNERIETAVPLGHHDRPYMYFGYENGIPYINHKTEGRRQLARSKINPEQSILAQRQEPDDYPELSFLGQVFGHIRLYREWSFGRFTPPRLPQKPDLPNEFLMDDARNLGLVINRMRKDPKAREKLLSSLQKLYEGVNDFEVDINGGTVQLMMQESKMPFIPATRLSDGTLRYLCLLAILCHPEPPPLVCIDEPELGLHPDILPTLARLLKDASARCQLIVTTHSDALVDELSDTPESVVVCEKHEGQTSLRRLSKEDLATWLKQYNLGELWCRGDLGGNRW